MEVQLGRSLAVTAWTQVLVIALICRSLSGGPGGRQAAAVSGGRGHGEPQVRAAARLSSADREDEFPAIGCDGAGRIWVAWVCWDGRRDEVVASVRGRDGWSKPLSLSRAGSDCWRPALQADGAGRLWATWSQNTAGNWDIWACVLGERGWSSPVRLTENPGNDFAQQLSCDRSGRVWMAWQAVVEGNYEVLVGRLSDGGLEAVRNVSRHRASDWEPAIAAGPDGAVYVAWDSFRNGSYDILVSRIDRDQIGRPILVAGSADYEAHATLAVDRRGRLWLAWDNGGPHWGQHGPSRLRLHSRRSVHLRCLAEGRTMGPEQPLDSVLTGELGRFCELPELQIDGAGRLWLFVRHLRDLTPPGRRRDGRPHQSRGIWNYYALCYANGRWSRPVKLPDSNGRNDMRLAHCLDAAGTVWAAWADDGRRPSRAEEPVNHNVHAAALSVQDGGPVQLPVRAVPAPAASSPKPLPARSRYQVAVAGRRYQLLFGDTHRHTDISRCAMNYDGSLMDTYRYAIDAAALDFLAISDHDQDLLKHRYGRQQQGPLQDYAWWRSQKYCDLFYIEGRFLPIYGYEHGGSMRRRGGHKNVLYPRRGLPCYEDDAPQALFQRLRDSGAVVIPHQLADGPSATDWSRWNRQFERVAEIFQARGSYEFFGAPLQARVQRPGHYLWDALADGVQIGVIASSDHGLVHSAYAGVYVEQFSRQGVLEGLRRQHSFGATDTMVLDLRLGERLLGDRADVSGPPTLQMHLQGTGPLKMVQVVRDGRVVFSAAPQQRSCTLRFTDMDLPAGQAAYYYLRCQQTDNQWAWSSALWVRRSR